MIEVTVSGPFTAKTLNVASDVAYAARMSDVPVNVTLAPMCGEPLKTDLGPLPSCCLPAGHDGDHDPYGRSA